MSTRVDVGCKAGAFHNPLTCGPRFLAVDSLRSRAVRCRLRRPSGCDRGDSAASRPNGDGRAELLIIDEADPTATPRVYQAAAGVDFRSGGIVPVALSAGTPWSDPIIPPHMLDQPTPTPTPVRRPTWSSTLLKQVVASGPSDRPFVALTLDDGWSTRDAVLNILLAKKVKLSLFLAGRPIVGDYAFVARALNAGCEIANHTMDHYDLTAKTAAYIQDDLAQFENLVKTQVAGATTVPFMRPSGGALNQTVIDAASAVGYRPVLWNVSSGDGAASTTPTQMTQNALAGAKPGSIILMHFSDRALTALPPLIDGLRAKGLEPVTLTKLFENVKG
jgi:peptidoglycan-N-acetylglucosamine deacetylase